MSDQEFEFEDVPAFNEHELSDTSTNSQHGKPGNKRSLSKNTIQSNNPYKPWQNTTHILTSGPT